MNTAAGKRPVPVPSKTSRPFWDAAKERRLVIQYDPQAKRWQFYPRAIGLDSGSRNLEWREVSGKGSIYSYTVTSIPTAGFEDKVPYALAIVDLDEGVRMLANLINIAPDDVTIGMRVRVCWEEIGGDAVYFAFEPDGNS
ncbi:MAG: Zn-ribbon domain-containing OB-fold protein [Hyphomicrobiales bacterium]|nr:Zn-ribbon domain-containing OB-fold protein [Hyphomicrobiales bacterium]